MSFAVEITGENFVSGNLFQVQLPGNQDLNDYDCSVGSMYIYYSWFNISAALGNNVYQLTLPIVGNPTLTITIDDGAYQISTLNNALQYYFYQNGYYLKNPTTLECFYFAAFVASPSNYKVDFITTAFPSSATSTDLTASPSLNSYVGITGSYTAAATDAIVGSAFTNNWPTTANQSAQLGVLSTNTFGSIIGFASGTFPSVPTISGTTLTTQSTLVPNVNPIYCVQCRLSCVYSKFSTNSQFLHQFTNGDTAVGALINASPSYYRARPCIGIHNTLNFTLFDQNGTPLGFLDPNVSIELNFLKTRNLDK